jgi:hypothetical protein
MAVKGRLTVVLDAVDKLPDINPGHLTTLLRCLPPGMC